MPHRFTDRTDGDLRVAASSTAWTWLRQVHGADVVVVSRPGEHAGAEADAAVTTVPGATLAVLVADCAPVALRADGVVGVAHAGWRGLVAGVLRSTVDAMRALGAGPITAEVGPCIHACCYEFGSGDAAAVSAAVGEEVFAAGALDLPRAVRAALRGAGVTDVAVDPTCTSCSARHWSHRRGADPERQGVLAWI